MAILSGVRVVDLSTGPVGGKATMVLADFGADVVKIERPGGDPFRQLPSAPLWLRGKRSAVLNLQDAEERGELLELIERADVAIVSGRAGRAARLGIDAPALQAHNPTLVHCSITGWGESGRYAHLPGYEGLVAARAGRMQVFASQAQRDGPVFAAVPVASHAASQGAVQGILAALLARARGGGGQRVETSLLRALLPYDLFELLLVQLSERAPGRFPNPRAVGGGMPTLNYHPVMAADGQWIQLGNLLEHLLYAFLDSIELLPELLAQEAFQSPPAEWSAEAIEIARDRILERVRERKADEWMERFRASGNVAAEPILSAQQALGHADLIHNGDVVACDDPALGTLRQLGVLARFSATPGTVGGPAPLLGAHTDEVRRELRRPANMYRRPAPTSTRPPPPPGRPLDGVTILEVATIIAAPLATTLLADLGARVIKVEAIAGDPYRHLLPGGLLAVKTNAGKESICIDLKSADGRAILADLVPRADVLVHNFRPGVPERLGLGYDGARALRPDLLWVSVTGYGPRAPGAARPCAHPVAGAAMGGVHFQAGAGMPPSACNSIDELRDAARRLMRANEANPDPNTSVVVASAVLLGLWEREQRGTGQAISVNMLAANALANADDMLAYTGKPERATVDADLTGLTACYRLYAARDGWVFLAIATDAEWARFAEASGRPALFDDPRFADAAARESNGEALADALAALFAERDVDAWESALVPAGVGCVRADGYAGEYLAYGADATAEGLTAPVQHARFGTTLRWGPLVICNGGPDTLGPGVLAGEHTRALLSEIGRTPAQIDALYGAGTVASEDVAGT